MFEKWQKAIENATTENELNRIVEKCSVDEEITDSEYEYLYQMAINRWWQTVRESKEG